MLIRRYWLGVYRMLAAIVVPVVTLVTVVPSTAHAAIGDFTYRDRVSGKIFTLTALAAESMAWRPAVQAI